MGERRFSWPEGEPVGLPRDEDGASDATAAPARDSTEGSPSARTGFVLRVDFAGGRYRIERLLGEGSRKRVYLAHDTRLERDVAVAVVKTEGLDPTSLDRVRREVRALGRLGDHPHVVSVHDVDEEGEQTYIVTQYVAGGSVEDLLRRSEKRQLPIAEAVRIAAEVSQALEHAHASGIVHRDVKPGNIWLAADGTAKLGDFGLAVALDRSRVTTEGTMLGTVAYMAPEQALGRTADPRSDLYGLGATLYEMVTGRPPFVGDGPVAVISQHLHTLPVAPHWQNPDVPPALEALVLNLLAKVPEERPASAAAVREALLGIDLSAPVPEASAPEPKNVLDSLASGVFVGREEALRELRGATDRAREGQPGVVLLGGEAGIGKTRTAAELATYARIRGAQILYGRCFEGEGAPAFWPWVQVIRAYVHECDPRVLASEMGAGAADIAQVVSEVRERLPGLPAAATALDPDQARFRLFDGIVAFLRNAARRQALVLILDDLHWADRPTLLLLQFLAREVGGASLLVVGTYREAEVGRQHPLGQALVELSKEVGTKRIALGGLSEEEVERYIEMTAGITAPPALTSAVYRGTEGNPFFLQEVVRLLVTERRLERMEEVKSWSVAIPQGVREAIGRRLERLSPECNRVLAIAAVIGREFGLEVLERVSEVHGDALLDLLDEAVAARIVVDAVRPAGHYRFSHALVRETLHEELTTARQVRLHRRIGEALETIHTGALERRLSELAYHFCEGAAGGDARKGVEYALGAAERAQAAFAYEEGIRLCERGLAALELVEPLDEEFRCRLTLALGEAQMRTRKEAEGRSTLRQAAEEARRLGRTEWFARAAIGLTGHPSVGVPLEPWMVRLLEDAAAKLEGEESTLRVAVLSRLARGLYFESGAAERRRALFEQALAMARRVATPAATIEALAALQICSGPGELAERLAAVAEAIDLARLEGERWMEWWLLGWQVANHLCAGDVQAARRELQAGVLLAAELRQPYCLWGSTMQRACFALMTGPLSEADALVQEAVRVSQGVRPYDTMQAFAVQIFHVRAEQGRLVELQQLLEGGAAQNPANRAWRCGFAYTCVSIGEYDKARAEFDELAQGHFRDFPHDLFWLPAIVYLAETCVVLDDAERARELYDLLLPYADQCAVIAAGVVCKGAVSHFLGRLAGTMGRFDEAVAHFEHAIVLNEKLEAPTLVAQTQVHYAGVLLQRGRPGDLERASRLLFSALETARELGLSRLVESAVALKLRTQKAPDAPPMVPAEPSDRCLQPPSPTMPASISGKYEVLGELGRGGMGTVFRVRHVGLDAVFALKVIAEPLAQDPELVHRFQREARVMAQLRHPNIARVTDIDADGALHYFVMEYVVGKTLAEVLHEEGSLPLTRVIEIALAIGSALEYAHGLASPVVHRDVTPSNVLLEAGTGRVVVTDFGIAKVIGPLAMTRTGDFLGKARYAAPEQVRGDRDVDGRADVYSLGVLIHEMFSGRQLFAGLDEGEVMRRVVDDPGEHAAELGRLAPVGLRAIVRRAITKDRERRHQGVGELVVELERLLELSIPLRG